MNDKELDDLVKLWYEVYADIDISLESFICGRTGWLAEEYDHWVMTGQIPFG